jgi:hypothetical protein
MRILAIDPGPVESAWLVYDSRTATIEKYRKDPNDRTKAVVRAYAARRQGCGVDERLVIEKIESFGLAVGVTVFETVFWSGRFAEAWDGHFDRIGRMAIKMHLCQSSRAKDANIRQALIDRFGPSRELAIGNKAWPGPLYGISKDVWSALAVAVTYSDIHHRLI